MSTENGAIGWDDEVSASDADENQQQDEFVVLPKGTYPCTVMKIERGSFKGSSKLPPCNKVKLGIIIDGGELGRGWADHNFYMHRSTLWKIYQFMEAIGLRQKGDTTASAIPWSKVEKGMTCRCTIHPREWDGKDYNEVDKWLPPEQDAAAAGDEPDDSEY